ncbi:MAG: DUF6491 family protein [Gammaproteobacteria bacterium]|nr:DUF6491 family protein [Gammaproteobacteria bacterium]
MKLSQLILFVSILALSGCAASSEKVAEESQEKAATVCVSVRNISSFDAIDDQYLYVKALGKQRHFLFTMDRACFGLRSAQTIAVRDKFTRVCSDSFGEVIYRDIGRGLESCRIRDIEAAASKADVEKLAEDRKAKKRDE